MRHVISLGAGVQSSTMALMAKHGEIAPMPEVAIFADTGWEPRAVYTWLEWLKAELEPEISVVTVSAGDLRADQLNARIRGKANAETGERWASLPYFTYMAGAKREGRVRRQCTREYKIDPIETYLKRELLGLKPRQRVPKAPEIMQWRGISADEASRMKPSREPWMTVRYPLAMEHRMTRDDCKAWMTRRGYPEPPRSACIGCPFHSDHEWRTMKNSHPEEWRDAVQFDAAIREAGGIRGKTYLHRSCKPLPEVDLDTPADHGQWSLFGEECEGMCGV